MKFRKRIIEWLNGAPVPQQTHSTPVVAADVSLGGVMLCGGNHEDIIGDAIRSLDACVDGWVFVNTGESALASLRVARSLIAPNRRHIVEYPHQEFDCATARNFGLEQTHALGYNWAFILDTDERYVPGSFDLRAELPLVNFDVVLMRMSTLDYPKARVIRLPAPFQYRDRVHERPDGRFSFGEPDGPVVAELPKTKEELDRRNLRIRSVCEQWIRDEPENTRAWLHLGNTYIHTDELQLALPKFITVWQLSKFPEERAWAMVKASSCSIDSGNPEQGLGFALEGMRDCPWYPEFPMLAGIASVRLNRPESALAFANMAISIGKASPIPIQSPLRTGFTVPHAHWEGPWDLRAAILEVVGQSDQAEQSRSLCKLAEMRQLVTWKYEQLAGSS